MPKTSLKILGVDPTKNYYRVRFMDPATVKDCKVPAWAMTVAESVSKGAKVTMCVKEGWGVQSVLIPKKFHTIADARRLALRITQKIERSDKEVPKAWAGGNLEGPSHDEGGITVEMEGGEGVLMVEVMNDPIEKIYTGTNREIVHQMQLEHGGNPMMKNGGSVKPAEAWIELSYKDKDGIDWAKDRLTEDKITSVLTDAGIKCLSGNCPAGSGITLDTGVRDIVFYVPLDQKNKAVSAIKAELKLLNIPAKEMKVRSGESSMGKGGALGYEKGGPVYKIGQTVKVSTENDNEGYDSFRGRPLRITHIARSEDDHPGYDESMQGMALYDFVDAETEEDIPSSLYSYEIELYKKGGVTSHSFASGDIVTTSEHEGDWAVINAFEEWVSIKEVGTGKTYPERRRVNNKTLTMVQKWRK